ncbi:glutathione S-transferase family protein [Celerinatantimonas yamalensis]|uniref:Glutathione S-transferase family protein n=1 Tax=Celerinatantimonas yamalensis TaxID=559956 RepID=A0ABW9G5C5_9GAMM
MDANLRLVIGNKNYSSWSLRPWLLLKHFAIPFSEQSINLANHDAMLQMQQLSPSGQIPVLWANDIAVWDSLAICEWINTYYLDGQAWPIRAHLNALGRSMSAEMHAGFTLIRRSLPMNCRARVAIPDMPAALAEEIVRVEQLWQQALDASGGPWLLGSFSIADCMFAPMVLRLQTYELAVDEHLITYCQQIQRHEAIQAWLADAYQEVDVIESVEQLYNEQ